MARKTIAITESSPYAWDGNKGHNNFKGRAHKIAIACFILGIIAIIAIGIWIGVDLKRQKEVEDKVVVAPTTPASRAKTTLTVGNGTGSTSVQEKETTTQKDAPQTETPQPPPSSTSRTTKSSPPGIHTETTPTPSVPSPPPPSPTPPPPTPTPPPPTPPPPTPTPPPPTPSPPPPSPTPPPPTPTPPPPTPTPSPTPPPPTPTPPPPTPTPTPTPPPQTPPPPTPPPPSPSPSTPSSSRPIHTDSTPTTTTISSTATSTQAPAPAPAPPPTPAPAPPPPPPSSQVIAALEGAVSDPSRVYVSDFTNWDQTTTLDNVYNVEPQNVDEIQAVVRATKSLGLRLRTVGSGMSYSDLYPDEGQVMLRTKYLTTREEDGSSFTLGNGVVSAAAGLTLGEFVDFMIDNDVQTLSLPVAKEISLGGAISTASHGRSPSVGSISDFVVAVKYIDGDGNRQTVDSSTPEDLNKIRCCLGLCGVIYDITFKVEPLSMVKLLQGFESGNILIRNATYLAGLLQDNLGLELFYAPLSSLDDGDWSAYMSTGLIPDTYDPWQDMWWYRIFKTYEPDLPMRSSRKRRDIDDTLPPLISYNGTVNSSMSETTTSSPGMVHQALLLHKIAYELTASMIEPETILTYPESANHVNGSALAKSYSISIVIPDNKELNVVVKALELMFEILAEYRTRSDVPILTLETRWMSTSTNCVLCPEAYSDNVDHVLIFELISAAYKQSFTEFSNRVLATFRREWPDSRLQWSKFYHSSDIETFLKESRREAFSVMSTTSANSSVRTWDMFSSDFLSTISGASERK